MHMLLHLARTQKKTVITSIHQPNSALFHSFDKLIMLAEGNVVYFGSPRNSLAYLRNCKLACPDGYNAADHWMDLLVHDTAIEDSTMRMTSFSSEELTERQGIEMEDGITGNGDTGATASSTTGTATAVVVSSTGTGLGALAEDSPTTDVTQSKQSIGRDHHQIIKPTHSMTTREQLIRAWDNNLIADQMDLATVDQDDDETTNNAATFDKYNTSWGMQYRVLVHRSLKNSRSAIFTPINLIKSGAIGVVSGALWFQIDYTEATVFDLSSFFFFTMTYWVVSIFGVVIVILCHAGCMTSVLLAIALPSD